MRSATSPVHHAMSSLKAPPAASPASPAARAWVPVLSLPRSRAAMTTPRSSAASRRPERRNSRATIAATIHAGRTRPTTMIKVAMTSSLSATGSSRRPRGARQGRIGALVSLFGKVLVANRGEIAVRVFRTLRELEIGTVAIYSEADRGSLHAASADEAFLVGPGPPAESYLHQERILAVAERAGVEAIHPGYGFLAENASFARAVENAGLVWIGPPPEAIELMGSKVAARERMAKAGVPIIPGTTEPVETADEAVRLGDEYGWPIAIKASAGGGGKGLKVVPGPEEAERSLAAARREGESYFSDPTVYVERFIEDPRHVEVQVLADVHGNVVHLGERDCTIQRRHQKIVEETPSPAVSLDLRERIGRIAVDAASAVGYRSAGTIEGLLDKEGNYWFLEMNTRIQVEHTITELVTGVDLVREQVLIAA